MDARATADRNSEQIDLDLQALRAFLAVIEHRHFGRAADELAISVSAVTKRIQRLEASVGMALLERDSGGVVGLTAAGRRFAQLAPTVLETARTAVVAAAAERLATLRIGFPGRMELAASTKPAALAAFHSALAQAHPGVGAVFVPTPFPRLPGDLLDGSLDVLISAGESPDPRIESVTLADIHRVGLVAVTHRFAFRTVVDAEEFARQPMLYTSDLPAEYMAAFALADVRPLDERNLTLLPASSTASVAQRVLRGREITTVPATLVHHLPPELRAVRLGGLPPFCYVAQRRRRDIRAEVLTAIELLVGFSETFT